MYISAMGIIRIEEGLSAQTYESAEPFGTMKEALFTALGSHPEYLSAASKAFENHRPDTSFLIGSLGVNVYIGNNHIYICTQNPIGSNKAGIIYETWGLTLSDVPRLTHNTKQQTGKEALIGGGNIIDNLPIPPGDDPVEIFLMNTGIKPSSNEGTHAVRDSRLSPPAVA